MKWMNVAYPSSYIFFLLHTFQLLKSTVLVIIVVDQTVAPTLVTYVPITEINSDEVDASYISFLATYEMVIEIDGASGDYECLNSI